MQDSGTNLNGLVISVHGRVQPYIADPLGRKSGINPNTNLRENEVPNSVISMDVDGGTISIKDAVDGTYTLYLKDAYNEDYRLILSYIDTEKADQKEYLDFNHANTTSFTFTIDSASENRLVINHTPLPPTGLQADAVDAGGLKTKLTWTASNDSDVTSYNIYSKEDDEPYLSLLDNTTDISYTTTHSWAENSTIKTRIYAVSAVKSDSSESFLSDMVENNDRDHDGLTDEKETSFGTDETNPDTDGDGLYDGEEYIYSTNPLLTDTDEDDYSDYDEIQAGSDPLDKDSVPTPTPTPTPTATGTAIPTVTPTPSPTPATTTTTTTTTTSTTTTTQSSGGGGGGGGGGKWRRRGRRRGWWHGNHHK